MASSKIFAWKVRVSHWAFIFAKSIKKEDRKEFWEEELVELVSSVSFRSQGEPWGSDSTQPNPATAGRPWGLWGQLQLLGFMPVAPTVKGSQVCPCWLHSQATAPMSAEVFRVAKQRGSSLPVDETCPCGNDCCCAGITNSDDWL